MADDAYVRRKQHANHGNETMKVNGNKVDTTGIKFSSKKETCDPVTYSVVATTTINGVNYSGDYCGSVDEGRIGTRPMQRTP